MRRNITATEPKSQPSSALGSVTLAARQEMARMVLHLSMSTALVSTKGLQAVHDIVVFLNSS